MGTLSIDMTYGLRNSHDIGEKLQIHDKEHFPSIGFEEGFLIMSNLPPEMGGEENKSWIKEIFTMFGMEVQEGDIIFQGNSIKIKFAPCCCYKPSRETSDQ